MAQPSDGNLWALAHAERAALAEDLAGLIPEQWQHATLCGRWDVEDVVAHLTAAASLNQRQWLRSMIGARFRPEVHNQRAALLRWSRQHPCARVVHPRHRPSTVCACSSSRSGRCRLAAADQ